MPPSHPQYLTDFFQTSRMCLAHRVYNISSGVFILPTWGQRNPCLRNAKPMGKYANSFFSENVRDICFIPSLVCFNTSIFNNTWLSSSLLGVLIQAWGQIRSTEVKWHFLLIKCQMIKIELPKCYHCIPLEQTSRMVCNMTQLSYHVTLSVLNPRTDGGADIRPPEVFSR